MRNLAQLVVAVSLWIGAVSVEAQSRPADEIPSEVRGAVNNILGDVLNAIHVFSATDSVSSGFYHFKADEDGGESDLDVMRVGVDFTLGDTDAQFVPFLNAMVGQVKLTEEISPLDGSAEQNDFTTVSTLSAGGGIGVDAKFWEHFHLIPKFEVVYSHTENNYDYNNTASQQVLAPFDGDIFNWDVDALSYVPSVLAFYRWQVPDQCFTLTPSINYSHLYINSYWDNSEILNVSSSSDILRARLVATAPLALGAHTFEGSVFGSRYDIFGDAKDGIGFDSYHEVGLGATTEPGDILPIFSRVGIVASYSWNSDFDGWRIGLEGDL